jgi:Trk K+ transport system NAD-binding subunit
VGAAVHSICEGVEDDMEIVAIIRAKEMLLPHPDRILQEGDRIVVIVSQKMKQKITDYLAPL